MQSKKNFPKWIIYRTPYQKNTSSILPAFSHLEHNYQIEKAIASTNTSHQHTSKHFRKKHTFLLQISFKQFGICILCYITKFYGYFFIKLFKKSLKTKFISLFLFFSLFFPTYIFNSKPKNARRSQNIKK